LLAMWIFPYKISFFIVTLTQKMQEGFSTKACVLQNQEHNFTSIIYIYTHTAATYHYHINIQEYYRKQAARSIH